MPISPIRRLFNIAVYVGIFAFLAHFSGQAFAHLDRMGQAVSTIHAQAGP